MNTAYAIGVNQGAFSVELAFEERSLVLDAARIGEHSLAVVPSVLGLAHVSAVRIEVHFLHARLKFSVC